MRTSDCLALEDEAAERIASMVAVPINRRFLDEEFMPRMFWLGLYDPLDRLDLPYANWLIANEVTAFIHRRWDGGVRYDLLFEDEQAAAAFRLCWERDLPSP